MGKLPKSVFSIMSTSCGHRGLWEGARGLKEKLNTTAGQAGMEAEHRLVPLAARW